MAAAIAVKCEQHDTSNRQSRDVLRFVYVSSLTQNTVSSHAKYFRKNVLLQQRAHR